VAEAAEDEAIVAEGFTRCDERVYGETRVAFLHT